MINNRQGQAGRRRGRGGNNNNGPRQNNPGRPDNGNRIDSRARGNASQLYEKYKTLASDMQRQGDRVTTEYYLQFADHYFRVLSEQRGRSDEQQPRRQRDDFEFDGPDEMGDEFGDEGEPVRAKEQWGEQGEAPRYEQARDDRPRGDRPREDRAREDRPREDQQRDRSRDDRPDRQRDDQPRADRPRDGQVNGQRDGHRDGQRGTQRDGQRETQTDDAQRDDRPRDGYRRDAGEQRPLREPREWQERGDRETRRPPRSDAGQPRAAEAQPVEVAGQRRAEPLNENQSLEDRAEAVLEADRPLDPPAPRRRGRPRREDANGASVPAAANADSGAVFQAELLPPSITLAANDEAPAEPKPRRRRARPAEDTPDAAE